MGGGGYKILVDMVVKFKVVYLWGGGKGRIFEEIEEGFDRCVPRSIL